MNTNGEVDVLAALDPRLLPEGLPNSINDRRRKDMKAARAAVAELVKAGRALLDGEPGDDEWERFESALVRVGGAA